MEEEPASRPTRADATRNRQRILETAYTAFAQGGPSVSLDEIARLAGVGAGTVHRHFASKDRLIQDVVEFRLTQLTIEARQHLTTAAGEGLFTYLRAAVATDRGLLVAMDGVGFDVGGSLPQIQRAFLAALDDLLEAARLAEKVRDDVDANQLKTLIVGFQAIRRHDPDIADGVIDLALDGLRPAHR